MKKNGQYRCRACGAWLETTNEQRSGLCGACEGLRQIEAALSNPAAVAAASAAVLALIPGGEDPRKVGHGLNVARLMATEGHLSDAGLLALLRLMHSGAEAYAYYAISGKPCVYAHGRRWSAAEWNASAAEIVGDVLTLAGRSAGSEALS
jgi:hypothetical protein